SNNHKFTIAFPNQTTPGAYSLTIGPYITDWSGNVMDQNGNRINGEVPSDEYTDTINLVPKVSAFSLVGLPSTVTIGTPYTFTVSALDGNGNPLAGYQGTVAFTSSDGAAVLPANYTYTTGDAGSHSFTVTFKTSGSQSLTVRDSASGISTTQSN